MSSSPPPTAPPAALTPTPRPRRLVIVRHGERVDFTFGEEWIQNCFDSSGKYNKKNLNLPSAVPHRPSPQDFVKDCPLTQIGSLQGSLVGKGLAEESILQPGFKIYVSPALRCVETGAAVLSGMSSASPQKLRIEPTLFEWTGWTPIRNPTWMSPDALVENGFEIDLDYQPFMDVTEIKVDESVEEYYKRSGEFVERLVKGDDNDILIIAHGSSLDSLTRQLVGGEVRNFREMMSVLRGVPYCGVAIAENTSPATSSNPLGTWTLISASSSNISMKHSSSADFCAWKSFMGEKVDDKSSEDKTCISNSHQ